MELYQEVVSCIVCGIRITRAGLRETDKDRVTRHAVDCPICRSRVPFAARSTARAPK
jgi:DNA-directed RNA polymerase subunit RPC12/RpoP